MERLQRMNGPSQGEKRVSQGDDLDDGLDFEQEKSVQEPLVYQDGKLLNNEIFFKSSKKRNREVEEGIEDDESDGSETGSDENESEMGSKENESEIGSNENDSEIGSIENESEIGLNENDSEIGSSNLDNEIDDQFGLKSENGQDDNHIASDIDNQNSLPFTFQAPSTLDEFMVLINGRSNEEIDTIIHRIRVLYNKRLHADNKKKLEVVKLTSTTRHC